MYTQCPRCLAIFTATEDQLSAHDGLVRCGHCSRVFNATENEVGGDQPSMPEVVRSGDVEPGDVIETGKTEAQTTKAGDQTPVQYTETNPPASHPHAVSDASGKGALNANSTSSDLSTNDLSDLAAETEEILIEAPRALQAIDLDMETAREPVIPHDRKGELSESHASNRWTRRAPIPSTDSDDSRLEQTGRIEPDIGAIKRPSILPDATRRTRARSRWLHPATWSIVVFVLLLLLGWQVKSFYFQELAQVQWLRPYLVRVCDLVGCEVPPRVAFAQIDMAGTSIAANPESPGGLLIEVKLSNRAKFAQPYPPIQVTLTDKEGRVVGQRTFPPEAYNRGDTSLLAANEIGSIQIALANPSEQAVGYEVQLMSP